MIKKLQIFSPIKRADEECLKRFSVSLDEIRLEAFFQTGILLKDEKIWLKTTFFETETNNIFYTAFVDDPQTHIPFVGVSFEVDLNKRRIKKVICELI